MSSPTYAICEEPTVLDTSTRKLQKKSNLDEKFQPLSNLEENNSLKVCSDSIERLEICFNAIKNSFKTFDIIRSNLKNVVTIGSPNIHPNFIFPTNSKIVLFRKNRYIDRLFPEISDIRSFLKSYCIKIKETEVKSEETQTQKSPIKMTISEAIARDKEDMAKIIQQEEEWKNNIFAELESSSDE